MQLQIFTVRGMAMCQNAFEVAQITRLNQVKNPGAFAQFFDETDNGTILGFIVIFILIAIVIFFLVWLLVKSFRDIKKQQKQKEDEEWKTVREKQAASKITQGSARDSAPMGQSSSYQNTTPSNDTLDSDLNYSYDLIGDISLIDIKSLYANSYPTDNPLAVTAEEIKLLSRLNNLSLSGISLPSYFQDYHFNYAEELTQFFNFDLLEIQEVNRTDKLLLTPRGKNLVEQNRKVLLIYDNFMSEIGPYEINRRAQELLHKVINGARNSEQALKDAEIMIQYITNPLKVSTYQISLTYGLLGDSYSHLGLPQKAITAYENGLSANPNLPVKRKLKSEREKIQP